MPASSQASSELSTASLTAVRRAFLGLSKPSRCLFLAKNSLTEMSRCFAAIDSAVTARRFDCSPVSLRFGMFCTLLFAVLYFGASYREELESQSAACNSGVLATLRASSPSSHNLAYLIISGQKSLSSVNQPP